MKFSSMKLADMKLSSHNSISAHMNPYLNKGNYPYVTARVKGKKRNLLTVDTYPKLMKMGNSQIARLLGEAAYHREMAELARKYSGNELVERALNMNLARTYREIYGFSKGNLKNMLAAYLDWWNVYNIKVIIRGVHHRIPPEDIKEYLVPAGSLSEELLASMVEHESVDMVMETLESHEYRTPSQDDMSNIGKPGQGLRAVEDFYDRTYYSHLLDSACGRSRPARIYREFIRKSIDVLNAKNLMEMLLEGFDVSKVEKYMIPGGRALPVETLSRIAGLSPAEALEEIKKALDTDLGGVGAENANAISVQLDRHLMAVSEKLSNVYPLSILPVIDFIIRKEKETKFIRIIVKGKEHSLPEKRIRELLAI